MTTTLDQRTLDALAAIATAEEITIFISILNSISAGHAQAWMAAYVANILNRLALRSPSPVNALTWQNEAPKE